MEEFGWLMDKTWYSKNVRHLPASRPGKRQNELTTSDVAAIAAAKALYPQTTGIIGANPAGING